VVANVLLELTIEWKRVSPTCYLEYWVNFELESRILIDKSVEKNTTGLLYLRA